MVVKNLPLGNDYKGFVTGDRGDSVWTSHSDNVQTRRAVPTACHDQSPSSVRAFWMPCLGRHRRAPDLVEQGGGRAAVLGVVAFVTGASSGIGKAASLALVEVGFEVIGTSRNTAGVAQRDRVTFRCHADDEGRAAAPARPGRRTNHQHLVRTRGSSPPLTWPSMPRPNMRQRPTRSQSRGTPPGRRPHASACCAALSPPGRSTSRSAKLNRLAG